MAFTIRLRCLRSNSLTRACILSTLLVTLVCFLWVRLHSSFTYSIPRYSPSQSTHSSSSPPNPRTWTKTIWQTSKVPVDELYDEQKERYQTWHALNPEYRHEVMTDERMAQYVREKYGGTEVEEAYFEIQDYILLSDLVRYMILFQDGGVYNDLDVGCMKPINSWVPERFTEAAGVVLGVEVDNKFGPDGRTFDNGEDLFELVNWTLVAKPNQPFIRFLIQRVLDNVKFLAERQNKSLRNMEVGSVQDVLHTTGPAAMTNAFFDYAANVTASQVTHKNFTKITEPKLVAEVLILPIHAFGASHQVQWAGFEPDANSALVHHYFSGSWYSDHVWSLPNKSRSN